MLEMAGRLAMNPDPFTWRELETMDYSNRWESWDQTSRVMAAVMNAQRTKNPVIPEKINPMAGERRKRERMVETRAQPAEISPLIRWL